MQNNVFENIQKKKKRKKHQPSTSIKSLANTQEFLIIYPNFYLHLRSPDEKPILVHLSGAAKAQGIQQFKLCCDFWHPKITQSHHTEGTGNTQLIRETHLAVFVTQFPKEVTTQAMRLHSWSRQMILFLRIQGLIHLY